MTYEESREGNLFFKNKPNPPVQYYTEANINIYICVKLHFNIIGEYEIIVKNENS